MAEPDSSTVTVIDVARACFVRLKLTVAAEGETSNVTFELVLVVVFVTPVWVEGEERLETG